MLRADDHAAYKSEEHGGGDQRQESVPLPSLLEERGSLDNLSAGVPLLLLTEAEVHPLHGDYCAEDRAGGENDGEAGLSEAPVVVLDIYAQTLVVNRLHSHRNF